MTAGPATPLEILGTLTAAGGADAAAGIREVAKALVPAERVLLTSHVHPDGDSLGSEVALALGLRRLGKQVRAVNQDKGPERLLALLPGGVLETASEPPAGPFDAVVVLDTSEPERVGRLKPVLDREGCLRLCVDHHVTRGPSPFDRHVVVPEAPATAFLVAGLLEALGVVPDLDIARALWIGLATDTGWFRFANTTPPALELAAYLLAQGLDVERLYDALYGTQKVERARLLGAMLTRLTTELEGRWVWSVITQELLVEHGVGLEELEGMVEYLKTLHGAEVVALVVEREPGKYKVSLRARHEVDVEEVARRFGGGGHRKAAGFRFEGRFEDLIAGLRAAVGAALRTP